MKWIGSHIRVDEGDTVASCKINRLFFVDDSVLFAPFEQGLQHALRKFSVACDQVAMKINTEGLRICVFPEFQASVHCNQAAIHRPATWGAIEQLSPSKFFKRYAFVRYSNKLHYFAPPESITWLRPCIATSTLGWYSRVTEARTRLKHGLANVREPHCSVCTHETGAFKYRKAVSFLIRLCSDPHLQS